MVRPLVPDDTFRRLVRARDHLHARAGDRLVLDELAAIAGLSRFHFARRWKDAFGLTPHQYLTRVRLRRAQALLLGDAPVTDVCLEVGFSSLGSFSSLFAERLGCPPTAWRRRFWQVSHGLVDPRSRWLIPGCYLDRFAA